MFSIKKKKYGRITRRVATIVSAAVVVAIIASGMSGAQASTLGQTQGDGQTQAQALPEGQQAGRLPGSPNASCPPDGQCFADVPSSNPFYAFANRIYQQDLVTGYPCGGADEPCDANNRPYYRPGANVTRQQMAKFIDNARHLPQIQMDVVSGTAPIYSNNDTGTAIAAYSTSGQALVSISVSQPAIYAQTGESIAVSGYSYGSTSSSIGVAGSGLIGVKGLAGRFGYGVWGEGGALDTGVRGTSDDGSAIVGDSDTGTGIWGDSFSGEGAVGSSHTNYGVIGGSVTSAGVYARSSYSDGLYASSIYGRAAHLAGNVQVSGNMTVTGNLSKGAGSFLIDNPLDPENKYLYHSFVESPDMMNIYNGNVTTDANGDAIVTLPPYFEALNCDYRYQLTVIGQFAQAIVSEKVKDNHFTIKTDKPGVEVSWQVTGIRQDPYANAHRIPEEQDKPANERGKYLHPTEWGQPESSGIGYEERQQRLESMPTLP